MARILKYAVLSDEYFSKPTTSPISVMKTVRIYTGGQVYHWGSGLLILVFA